MGDGLFEGTAFKQTDPSTQRILILSPRSANVYYSYGSVSNKPKYITLFHYGNILCLISRSTRVNLQPGQPFSLLATYSVLLVQRKLSLKELNEHLGETEPDDDRKNNGEQFNPVYHSRHRTALCGGL